jgi:hypothetical protein
MGLMLSRALIITALCLSLTSCKGFIDQYKRSSSGTAAIDKKVLFDFRQAPAPSLANAASCAPAPAGCSQVLGQQDGSFTYAAETERACLYRCSAGNKIDVSSHGKPQVSAETPYSGIIGKFDLNQDDKDELLLSTETTHNGDISREASLVNFEKNTLRAVEDFGIVYHDPCSAFASADEAKRKKLLAGGRSPFMEAVVISYLPRPEHQMPSFTAQRYRAPCPTTPGAAPTVWKLVTE